VRKQTEWQFHQTEEMAWGYLGNEERMKEFGKLMEQAKSSAETNMDKKRVELFEKGVWDHMAAGRKRYLEKNNPETVKQKQQREADRDKLKAEPPPSVTIPAVPDGAAGDPMKIDWSKALVLGKWSTVTGYPTDRKITITLRLLHDKSHLYAQLEDMTDTAKLVNINPDIWAGDDWEVFFSAQRGKGPYHHFLVNPAGKFLKRAYGEESREWRSEINVVSNSSEKNKWIVSLAFPLETLLSGGVQPGHKFYANFYRAVTELQKNQVFSLKENLAWSPNFDESFHALDRLGEFTLE
jgi:hypothetical protein